MASTTPSGASPFWPWSAKLALWLVPTLLIIMLLVLALTRSVAGWPSEASETIILIGVLVLAVLPVVLLLLGRIATAQGSVEAFGVSLRFGEQPRPREITVPPTIGLEPDARLDDSGNRQILSVLQRSQANDVAVIDLGDGTQWWDTRLLVVASGAARLRRPKAIVFVATIAGRQGAFKGWLEPDDLLRGILRERTDLRTTHQRAAAICRQWELAVPAPEAGIAGAATPPGPPQLPFPAYPQFQHLAYTDGRPNPWAPEQILAASLADIEGQLAYRKVTPNRVDDICGDSLRTVSVDIEQQEDGTWIGAVWRNADPYVALTNDGVYVGLISRDQALNVILSALVDND